MSKSPSPLPSPAELRAELAALSHDARKIVGGLVVVMMREPGRVREREWLLETYTLLAAEALGLGDAEVERLEAFVRSERDATLNAAFGLFLRVAADLEGLGANPGAPPATLGQATVVALSYFEPV